MSADGRYVAFESYAGDLVPGDHTIYFPDVFVRDLVAKTTVRASVNTGGGDLDSGSYAPSISADGRYVAFYSAASDLVPGDENGTYDVFVRDLVAGATVRASVDIGGGDPNRDSYGPSLSDDGRYVAFYSFANDLVPGDSNLFYDVFVRDLVAGTTVRVSVDTEGGDPNEDCEFPSISADGRSVAFSSYASDLVMADDNGVQDIFVRDLLAGTTVRASVDIEGGDSDGRSLDPSMSADGGHIAFESYASDLVAGDGNVGYDIFVRDLVAGTTVRASVDIEGGDPDDVSFSPSITANGRYVAYHSFATDLVPGDRNGFVDVFVRNLMAGTTVRTSVDRDGGDANADSQDATISPDGQYVVFASYASDLVAWRGDAGDDVFLSR